MRKLSQPGLGRAVFVIVATAVAWIGPSINVSATAAPLAAPTAVVIVDGVRIPAVPGAIVKTGTADGQGNCLGLDRAVEVRASAETQFGSIELEVTANCTLRVVAVTFDRTAHLSPVRPAAALTPQAAQRDGTLRSAAVAPILSFQAAAATTYQIWSDESFFEQFGIKVTEAFNRFNYLDNSSSVTNETRAEAWCWQDGVGWTIDSCQWRDFSSPPSYIYTNTLGSFHNSCCGGIAHTLQANGWAQPGGVWSFWCNFTGTAPLFWHDNCTGGRSIL
jgi:hypothetical protein